MIYVLTLIAYMNYRKSNDYMQDGFLVIAPKTLVPLAIIFFAFIFITLFFNPDSRIPAIGSTIWLVVFGLISWWQPKKAIK